MAASAATHPILTERKLEYLREIHMFHLRNHYAPTIQDLCQLLHTTSKSTVWNHLASLQEMGLVDWLPGQNRTLHVTVHGRAILAHPARAAIFSH